MQLTQPDGESSPLERMENLAAKLQVEHHAQRRSDIGSNGADSLAIGRYIGYQKVEGFNFVRFEEIICVQDEKIVFSTNL